MSARHYYVYILGNAKPVLYIGVTNDLLRRVHEHKMGVVEGFTKIYGLKKLLYYEIFDDVRLAIEREKQLKHWKRAWKLGLICQLNPILKDLYNDIVA